MESSPASKCPASDRSDDVQDPVRNGVRLDGKWEHQRLCEGTSGSKPVEAGRISVSESHYLRFELTNDWMTRPAGRRH